MAVAVVLAIVGLVCTAVAAVAIWGPWSLVLLVGLALLVGGLFAVDADR